jgi:hypothetical protein
MSYLKSIYYKLDKNISDDLADPEHRVRGVVKIIGLCFIPLIILSLVF